MTTAEGLHGGKNARLISIDALRGFIMFWMLLHTFGLKDVASVPVVGFIFTQLNHVPWVGFHFEDLILPTFLFIIGISMGISETRRSDRGESPGARTSHAFKRAITLFVIGFIGTWIAVGKPSWGPGVPQVLAFCYFGGYLFVRMTVKMQFFVCAALLFVYWFFIFVTPIPEAGRNSYEVFKNLVYFIDNRLTGSTSRWGYLYPTITSVAVVVYGSIIGKVLAKRPSPARFMKTLAVYGFIGVACGLLLHPFIPVIKRMFTPSYALLTCGLASLLLLLFYWIIEVLGRVKWSFFFVVIGMNSIFVYILDMLFNGWLVKTTNVLLNPLAYYLGGWISPGAELMRMTALWLICLWLYRRRIFFKL